MKTIYMRPTYSRKKMGVLWLLTGVQDSGKTTVLTTLCHELQKEALFYYEQKGKVNTPDLRVVMKVYGKIVGICTAGDDPTNLNDNLDFFKHFGCEIGIMAVRTASGTSQRLLQYAQTQAMQKKLAASAAVCGTTVKKKVPHGISAQTWLYVHAFILALSSGVNANVFQKLQGINQMIP